MKKFTPPPASSSSSEAESEDESEEPSEASVVHDDVVRACDKTEDEYLKMVYILYTFHLERYFSKIRTYHNSCHVHVNRLKKRKKPKH